MEILWSDCGDMHIARLRQYVILMTKDWGGSLHPRKTNLLGYVQKYRQRTEWLAQTYGSVNPDSHGATFYNIDDAKAYVEQQALIGIAINKLTR